MNSRKGLPTEIGSLEDGIYTVVVNPVLKELQVPWRGGCLVSYLSLPEKETSWQGVPAILVHLQNPHGFSNDAPLYCRVCRNDLTGVISFEDIKQYKKLLIGKGKIKEIL